MGGGEEFRALLSVVAICGRWERGKGLGEMRRWIILRSFLKPPTLHTASLKSPMNILLVFKEW